MKAVIFCAGVALMMWMFVIGYAAGRGPGTDGATHGDECPMPSSRALCVELVSAMCDRVERCDMIPGDCLRDVFGYDFCFQIDDGLVLKDVGVFYDECIPAVRDAQCDDETPWADACMSVF